MRLIPDIAVGAVEDLTTHIVEQPQDARTKVDRMKIILTFIQEACDAQAFSSNGIISFESLGAFTEWGPLAPRLFGHFMQNMVNLMSGLNTKILENYKQLYTTAFLAIDWARKSNSMQDGDKEQFSEHLFKMLIITIGYRLVALDKDCTDKLVINLVRGITDYQSLEKTITMFTHELDGKLGIHDLILFAKIMIELNEMAWVEEGDYLYHLCVMHIRTLIEQCFSDKTPKGTEIMLNFAFSSCTTGSLKNFRIASIRQWLASIETPPPPLEAATPLTVQEEDGIKDDAGGQHVGSDIPDTSTSSSSVDHMDDSA